MYFEEYLENQKILDQRFNAAKKKLLIEYAKANNPYRVGDIIQDHIGYLKVQKIKYTYDNFTKEPYCIYQGVALTKQLKPKARGSNRSVHQINIV